MIDLYCERTAAGLFGEPLNLLSNLGFLTAAVLLLPHTGAAAHRGVKMLVALVALIGIGSAAFHAFANAWSQWLDVIPIAAFEFGFLGLYLRHVRGSSARGIAIALAAFAAALVACSSWPAVLNGSLAYLPAAAVLLLLGVDLNQRFGRADLLGAAALFTLSLAARSVDNAWCAKLPFGTHWAWHLCNAGVLFLATRGLARSARVVSHKDVL